MEKEAAGEGIRFLTRLIEEWHSGANRFNAPGECLMAACRNQQLIGIGGLSVDPFAEKSMARLRRVYVRASSRRHQVGQTLEKALISHAGLRFQNVCLFTDTAAGDALYLGCGFMGTDDNHATNTIEQHLTQTTSEMSQRGAAHCDG
ncbi:GNAT family N-acetyltransferase [Pseudomonas tremae]|uniref:GNAT family N-acetyltransferase n=1 Tax=Pseudomonas tremae TaxID=200454 RepID=UPI001F193660|nr:GNAT family N-acetyltransferase [Pseudomonas tremae]